MIARRVAKKLAPPPPGREPWERGVVVAVDSTTKTLTLKIGGSTAVTPGVRYPDTYAHPVAGETVLVTYDGPSPWVLARNTPRTTLSEPIVCTSTTRPAGTSGGAWPTNVPLTQGLTIFETDTGKVLTWYSSTTGWQNPNWSAPWGRVAYATATAAQAAIGAGPTDLTSLTVNWTPVGNRKFETRLYLPELLQNTSAGAINPTITDSGGTVKAGAKRTQVAAGNDAFLVIEPEFFPSGSTTRKGRLGTSAGTVTPNFSATSKAYIEVVDLGPNGAPV